MPDVSNIIAESDQHPTLPVIAIDGASGAGKGTLTTRLANKLNYEILDSGALYRIVGLLAAKQNLLNETIDETSLTQLAQSLDIKFAPSQDSEHISVIVNGDNIGDAIRTEEVGDYASKVAVFPGVRVALFALQKNMASSTVNAKSGLIADGRDMGTVVFPTAPLKVYLVASAQARAQRRVNQLISNGQIADYDAILAQIVARDERDSNRATAPAKPADDAIVIETSDMNADEVFEQVWQLCQDRGLV